MQWECDTRAIGVRHACETRVRYTLRLTGTVRVLTGYTRITIANSNFIHTTHAVQVASFPDSFPLHTFIIEICDTRRESQGTRLHVRYRIVQDTHSLE